MSAQEIGNVALQGHSALGRYMYYCMLRCARMDYCNLLLFHETSGHAALMHACRTQPDQLISVYKSLLQKCTPGGQPPGSYNLLLTSDHMILVPRRIEKIGSVAINALGFAGTILVNSKAGLEYIQEQGPIEILEAAGCPWQKSA